MNKDRIADVAASGAWAFWGLSLAQINEVLTALSLLAAIFCSICAGLYYLAKRRLDR
jgi:hypothetical protein